MDGWMALQTSRLFKLRYEPPVVKATVLLRAALNHSSPGTIIALNYR